MIPLNLKRSPFPTRKNAFFIELQLQIAIPFDIVSYAKRLTYFITTKSFSPRFSEK